MWRGRVRGEVIGTGGRLDKEAAASGCWRGGFGVSWRLMEGSWTS